MRLRVRALVFSTVFLFVSGALGHLPAQGCSRTLEDASEDLTSVAEIFTSLGEAAVRGDDIEQVDPHAPQYLVTEDSVCQMVLDQAVPYLRSVEAVWAAHQEGDFRMALYRVGPYYALEILDEPLYRAALEGQFGRNLLIIFRVADLARVAVLM